MKKYRFFMVLNVSTFIILIWSGINPISYKVWFWHMPIIIFIILGILYLSRNNPYSDMGYFLLYIWIIWHIIGSKYGFMHSPFGGFFSDIFGLERNAHDRIAHFLVGFSAYLLAEIYLRNGYVSKKRPAVWFAFCTIGMAAATYEVFEWMSTWIDKDVGILSIQGDIWDSQKDMALDMLGAAFSLVLFDRFCNVDPVVS